MVVPRRMNRSGTMHSPSWGTTDFIGGEVPSVTRRGYGCGPSPTSYPRRMISPSRCCSWIRRGCSTMRRPWGWPLPFLDWAHCWVRIRFITSIREFRRTICSNWPCSVNMAVWHSSPTERWTGMVMARKRARRRTPGELHGLFPTCRFTKESSGFIQNLRGHEW